MSEPLKLKTRLNVDGLENVLVSTVLLAKDSGMNDHNYPYQTCIFYDRGSKVVGSYKTVEDAKAGHDLHIQKFKEEGVDYVS